MEDIDKQTLLGFVRETAGASLASEPLPSPDGLPDTTDFGGAFVTFRNKGRLRGCMGRFRPEHNLAATLQQVTLSSLRDPRFRERPIAVNELGDLSVEISILSKPVRVADPSEVEAGIHGILVRKDHAEGCFLPQVATEQRWGREELLSRCCTLKAGLPPDAWRDPETEIHVFTADVISDA